MLKGPQGDERVYLALGGLAGLRTAEIVGNEDHKGMQWEWIDFERNEIIVPLEITKKKRERLVPMNEKWKSILHPLRATGAVCKIFNKPLIAFAAVSLKLLD